MRRKGVSKQVTQQAMNKWQRRDKPLSGSRSRFHIDHPVRSIKHNTNVYEQQRVRGTLNVWNLQLASLRLQPSSAGHSGDHGMWHRAVW
jgi:hypothetical protein